jgi:hypothetical protein
VRLPGGAAMTKLNDLGPVFPADNVLDRWDGDAEHLGDFEVSQAAPAHDPDADYILCREASTTIARTHARSGPSSWMIITRQGSPASLAPHVLNVVGLCPEKQMVRPDTQSRVAAMQDTHSCRDGSVGQSPRNAVGSVVASSNPDMTVTTMSAGPEPTVTRFVDLLPESGYKRSSDGPRSSLIDAFGHGRLR